MAKHNELGAHGEVIALDFLQRQDFTILATNYRSGRAEIDLIVKKEDTLIFVEVKTRSDDFLYDPLTAVTPKKQALIRRGAMAYMRETNYEWAIRFDVILIVIRAADRFEIRHVADAFI